MQKAYKYILFDLDGTLSDPKVGITKSIQYALKHYNININDLDTLTPCIGPPLKDSFMHFFNFDENTAYEAIEKYREYFGKKGMYENLIYDGIDELLSNLVEMDKTLIVATSKAAVFAEGILEYFNIDNYFTFVSGSELDGSRTRKSEVIQYALEQNNITDLNQVVMIGDRKHDIIGAKEIGVDSIGVLYGYGDYEELSNARATYIVNDISELSKLLMR